MGGLIFKLFDTLILWAKEKREQHGLQIAKEKDRPRFRVDVSIDKTGHPELPTIVVKILSLGGLPITINQGYVTINPAQYPSAIQTRELSGKEIGPDAPIEEKFPIKMGILRPISGEKTEIKLVCEFSYGKNERYNDEQRYNRTRDQFEHV